MSSIFDIFKSNNTKIAEQEKLILDQAEALADQQREIEHGKIKENDLKLKIEARETKIHDLGKEIDRVESNKKIQIDEMKADRKLHDDRVAAERQMHEQKLEHLVACKTESLAIEHDKKVVELERKSAADVAVIKDKYQDKLVKQLEKETQGIKEMYSQILTRLPNLNASMHLGGPKEVASEK